MLEPQLFSLPLVGRAGVGIGRWFRKELRFNSGNSARPPTLTLPTRGRGFAQIDETNDFLHIAKMHQKSHFIHEGHCAAEVEVTYVNDNSPWSPIVEKEDVFKTDRVRLALRRGDVKAAAKKAKVFESMPFTGSK